MKAAKSAALQRLASRGIGPKGSSQPDPVRLCFRDGGFAASMQSHPGHPERAWAQRRCSRAICIFACTLFTASIFQDHLRQRLLFGVCDGERGPLHAELCRELRAFAFDRDSRASPGCASDFKILPADSAPKPGTDGLHGGFFRRKPRGVPLDAVALALAVRTLGVGEYALQETLTKAVNGLAHPPDLANIDAGAHDGH